MNVFNIWGGITIYCPTPWHPAYTGYPETKSGNLWLWFYIKNNGSQSHKKMSESLWLRLINFFFNLWKSQKDIRVDCCKQMLIEYNLII